jgi:hypothetical protein
MQPDMENLDAVADLAVALAVQTGCASRTIGQTEGARQLLITITRYPVVLPDDKITC